MGIGCRMVVSAQTQSNSDLWAVRFILIIDVYTEAGNEIGFLPVTEVTLIFV